ncbi:MAG: hypothetical protein WCL44_03805 [bacterium]
MALLDWCALTVVAGLVCSGLFAVYRQQARTPEERRDRHAIGIGLPWMVPGAILVMAAAFDSRLMKSFFKPFLEAAN